LLDTRRARTMMYDRAWFRDAYNAGAALSESR